MFVALVEVEPLSAEALGEGVVGGMVRCYTPATSKKDALNRIKAKLGEVGVRLVRVEWCVNNDEVEWEAQDDVTAAALIADATATGGPVLSEFHVWTSEE